MFTKSCSWSDDPRFAHTQRMVEVCPTVLLPTVSQNCATGGVSIQWPDVCRCPVNGGVTNEVHELQRNCPTGADLDESDLDDGQWSCNCPTGHTMDIDGITHVATCPFNACGLGTCHPMCSLVTGDDRDIYCHCPCHG